MADIHHVCNKVLGIKSKHFELYELLKYRRTALLKRYTESKKDMLEFFVVGEENFSFIKAVTLFRESQCRL